MSKESLTPNDTAREADVVNAAVDVYQRGFTPLPVLAGAKRPSISTWQRVRWPEPPTEQGAGEVRSRFEEYADGGALNLGVSLGEPSGDLIDVDIDHPSATRLRHYFLPRTAARHGRATNPDSHYWYIATEGTLPGTRRFKIPDPEDPARTVVSVELRTTGAQTVVPPSIHPDTGEQYKWVGEPWGGDEGPALIDGKVLTVQVALLALGAVLIDRWPRQGGRHDAYVALAGGLLRYGDGVHPFWERNVEVLIRALAQATHDEDGPDQRVTESVATTIRKLQDGAPVQGFPTLASIIGESHAEMVRRLASEVESAAGFRPDVPVISDSVPQVPSRARSEDGVMGPLLSKDLGGEAETRPGTCSQVPDEDRDPLEERLATWEPVDLEPYIAGQVRPAAPEVLSRSDGQNLMYRGRVNMLYGSSESAKSWIALNTAMQEMAKGERVLYLDFEDEPVQTLNRLRLMGAADDDLRLQFSYIRPEEPLAPMQRNRWGTTTPSDIGTLNQSLFSKALESLDPSLIVADGMTSLYGLHGLDANDAVSTDVITSWLKKLTRNGRSTVIIIDHMAKSGEKGTLPLGSQHKVAMVQGTLLQVWPVRQPMPGAVGEVELVVLKDRPGSVRAASQASGGGKAQVAGIVTIDSSRAGQTEMTIAPPRNIVSQTASAVDVDLSNTKAAAKAEENARWEDVIMTIFQGELGRSLTRREILEDPNCIAAPRQAERAVERLVSYGVLEKTGKTRGVKYTLMIDVSGFSEDPPEEGFDVEVVDDLGSAQPLEPGTSGEGSAPSDLLIAPESIENGSYCVAQQVDTLPEPFETLDDADDVGEVEIDLEDFDDWPDEYDPHDWTGGITGELDVWDIVEREARTEW
jgi:hypothetical protein